MDFGPSEDIHKLSCYRQIKFRFRSIFEILGLARATCGKGLRCVCCTCSLKLILDQNDFKEL